MTPFQRELYEKAERQHSMVRDWLLSLMKQSAQKPATKNILRRVAMEKFKVSKASFDAGWNSAIMESGNEHWWEPLARSRRGAPGVN